MKYISTKASAIVRIKNIIDKTFIRLDVEKQQLKKFNAVLNNKPASRIANITNIGIVIIKLKLAIPDVSKFKLNR